MPTVIGVDTNTFYMAAACLPDLNPDIGPSFVAVGMAAKKYGLGKYAGERIPKLFKAFYEFLGHFAGTPEDIEVWVEEYAFSGGSRSTAEIAQCVEAIKDACILKGVACYIINNTQWKKEIVGKGNATKDETKAFLLRHFAWVPADLNPPDLYDAIAIAMAGSRRGNIAGELAH